MACCNKNKEDDRELPDGITPCCSVRGRRCFCLPYDDAWVISAQVLTIIATFLSWIWWVTMIVGIGGLVMFQLPWCCRQNGGAMYGAVAIATGVSLAMMGVGIYCAVVWKTVTDCYPFEMYSYTSTYIREGQDAPRDYCQEEVWAALSFVCSALWLAAAVCMFRFVKSGRHAKWEANHSPDIELAQAQPASGDAAVVADAPAVVLPENVKSEEEDV